MFVELSYNDNISIENIIFILFSVPADPIPSTVSPQGLKTEIVIAISVVGGLLFIFIILVIFCCAFFHRQRQQIKDYRSQFFPEYIGQHQVMCDFCFLQKESEKSECKSCCQCCFLFCIFVCKTTNKQTNADRQTEIQMQ